MLIVIRNVFQFHPGSIKSLTQKKPLVLLTKGKFQFHLGSIKGLT